jgi:hypothetical protein
MPPSRVIAVRPETPKRQCMGFRSQALQFCASGRNLQQKVSLQANPNQPLLEAAHQYSLLPVPNTSFNFTWVIKQPLLWEPHANLAAALATSSWSPLLLLFLFFTFTSSARWARPLQTGVITGTHVATPGSQHRRVSPSYSQSESSSLLI